MNRTPEQHAAIESPSQRLCIDAGAGSGKTRVLVERIVHLLETRRTRLEAVVAITFTEKAAAEMKQRLRAAFHHRAPEDDPDETTFWRDLERRVESARIGTIHAFCGALLRENALAIGIDPDFAVLADAEAKLLRTEITVDTVHDLLEKGDEATARVATALGAPKLIQLIEHMVAQRMLLERVAAEHPILTLRDDEFLTNPAFSKPETFPDGTVQD